MPQYPFLPVFDAQFTKMGNILVPHQCDRFSTNDDTGISVLPAIVLFIKINKTVNELFKLSLPVTCEA